MMPLLQSDLKLQKIHYLSLFPLGKQKNRLSIQLYSYLGAKLLTTFEYINHKVKLMHKETFFS